MQQELYVSYNDISDLSPLCLLEALEVLDLEGNCVEDLGQVRYLNLCPRLAMLTLEGNPVCLRPRPGPATQVRARVQARQQSALSGRRTGVLPGNVLLPWVLAYAQPSGEGEGPGVEPAPKGEAGRS